MCWGDTIVLRWASARLPLAHLGASRWRAAWTIVVVAAAVSTTRAELPPAAEAGGDIRGLPITRFYPYEEIGNVSRGPRLNFDAFGRVAVIQDGAYVVLNDANWIDLASRAPGEIAMLNVVQGANHRWYYGALGSFGLAEYSTDGRLRPRSLVPASAPKWVTTNNFSEILATKRAFYAGGWTGMVVIDFASGAQHYVPVQELSRVFALRDRVFAASHSQGIQLIDPETWVARRVPGTDVGAGGVDEAASLDDDRVLLSTLDGRLRIFDGSSLTDWKPPLGNGPNNRALAMRRLVDGGVAVAVNGRGLFLLSLNGEIRFALTSPEYHRITAIATREAGVLWVATESGIEKILYGSPVTMFGQRLGLPVSWPQVAQCNGRVIIASGGRLYEAVPGTAGNVSGFQSIANQPEFGAWAIAAKGSHTLVGNAQGVFEYTRDREFVPIVQPLDVARLVMVNPDLCFAIGAHTIAALRWSNGRWEECAPRIAGVGYPSVVHPAANSAWIELGPNRAARVSLHGSEIETRLFETFPWKEPRWVNIGVVGDIVVLSGPNSGRLFFSEKTEAFCEAPELQSLLDAAPFWITRVQADENGLLWATHERGIFTINPRDTAHRFDTATFDIINDRTPIVQLLPGGDVWISSGHSLYHAHERSGRGLRQQFHPVLTSVVDGQTNAELLQEFAGVEAPRLPFGRNSLNFRFFAGSYAARRGPAYEFRLNHRGDEWNALANGSVINFHQLREGDYRLDVRLTDSHGPVSEPIAIGFTILPPWYRTWYAYILGGAGAVTAMWVLVRSSNQRALARNAVLEQLVEKRTDELKVTMQKLAEEMRNAATLAERGRIAGEIHDSLQQGLSGLILQLDATLKLPGLSGDVRSRLSVARNMVSFTRHEVQHAVWDMESSLLDGAGLDDALRKITALISPGTVQIEITVAGTEVPLSSEIKHHLLRIAQEAITNAVRHADASTIAIQLEYGADAVLLAVMDNGRGFSPERVLVNGLGHFGLRGLRARAAKIGGDLQVVSSSGNGTSIRIRVPLTAGSHPKFHADAALH